MKCNKDCTQGSFTLPGAGFLFEYLAEQRMLNIRPLKSESVLARIKFDEYLAEDPLGYIQSLDKTNQIKALMYSNNASLDLSSIMEEHHMANLIEITARISRLAYDLNTKNFDRFSKLFCDDFDLKKLCIKSFKSGDNSNKFYLARIQTKHNNTVSVRACTLSGLAAALSDKTLKDLMTMEFGYNYSHSAQHLLNVSSKLATIARVLDKNFIPEHKLERYKKLQALQNPMIQNTGSSQETH